MNHVYQQCMMIRYTAVVLTESHTQNGHPAEILRARGSRGAQLPPASSRTALLGRVRTIDYQSCGISSSHFPVEQQHARCRSLTQLTLRPARAWLGSWLGLQSVVK